MLLWAFACVARAHGVQTIVTQLHRCLLWCFDAFVPKCMNIRFDEYMFWCNGNCVKCQTTRKTENEYSVLGHGHITIDVRMQLRFVRMLQWIASSFSIWKCHRLFGYIPNTMLHSFHLEDRNYMPLPITFYNYIDSKWISEIAKTGSSVHL